MFIFLHIFTLHETWQKKHTDDFLWERNKKVIPTPHFKTRNLDLFNKIYRKTQNISKLFQFKKLCHDTWETKSHCFIDSIGGILKCGLSSQINLVFSNMCLYFIEFLSYKKLYIWISVSTIKSVCWPGCPQKLFQIKNTNKSSHKWFSDKEKCIRGQPLTP